MTALPRNSRWNQQPRQTVVIHMALSRHHSLDWGDVDEEDKEENNLSEREGLRTS